MSIGTRSFGTSPGACDARNGNSSRQISVDTKKKELVGAFKNAGRTWRPAKTPQRVTGPRLRDPGHRHHGREGHSVWHLRSASQRRLGECWDRSRHRELRGTVDPALVAAHGSPGVSTSPVAVDHGGCRREQRGAPPVVEVGTAASGQSDGLGDHGLSLSAGYEQVEQDRASVVLAHRDELARHPTRRLGHDREPHWLDAQSVLDSAFGRNSTAANTRVASPSPMRSWRRYASSGIAFTATGTTRSIPLLREHKSQ